MTCPQWLKTTLLAIVGWTYLFSMIIGGFALLFYLMHQAEITPTTSTCVETTHGSVVCGHETR